ncbi:MAG TPA: acyltransferase [Chthoniobacterales bacterium]|jgi:acetyltransferase-like isoleucine patch superfamily enzyme
MLLIGKKIRDYLFGPRGLARLGAGAIIRPPFDLNGRDRIEIGENTIILSHANICALSGYADASLDGRVIIGNRVYIGRRFYIGGAAKLIKIGDDCVLSENVSIFDNSHGLSPEGLAIMQQALEDIREVVIGDSSFIGINSVILPGVTLGKHCVVGAGSVVTKSFSDYSMVAGVPARLLKRYNLETHCWEICR